MLFFFGGGGVPCRVWECLASYPCAEEGLTKVEGNDALAEKESRLTDSEETKELDYLIKSTSRYPNPFTKRLRYYYNVNLFVLPGHYSYNAPYPYIKLVFV